MVEASKFVVGTSGYSFADWVGPFYPAGTKSAGMFDYYARHFAAVELNFTFYAMPFPRTLDALARRSPGAFEFWVKANREITHKCNLSICHEFVENLGPLCEAGKLAGVLLQFPQSFHRNNACALPRRRPGPPPSGPPGRRVPPQVLGLSRHRRGPGPKGRGDGDSRRAGDRGPLPPAPAGDGELRLPAASTAATPPSGTAACPTATTTSTASRTQRDRPAVVQPAPAGREGLRLLQQLPQTARPPPTRRCSAGCWGKSRRTVGGRQRK